MNKRKLTDEEKQRRRDKYHEEITNPEKRKAHKQARREWFQKNYERIKADPVLWEARLEKQKIWRETHTENTKRSTIRYRLRDPVKWLWNQARKRAVLKGMEFTIEQSDIIIPEWCPIMGIPLEYIPEGYNDYSPSLDRIDNSKGYTKDNVWVISSIANRMKWTATKEQLQTFVKGVLSLEGRLAP